MALDRLSRRAARASFAESGPAAHVVWATPILPNASIVTRSTSSTSSGALTTSVRSATRSRRSISTVHPTSGSPRPCTIIVSLGSRSRPSRLKNLTTALRSGSSNYGR